jgi:hypothetical protein
MQLLKCNTRFFFTSTGCETESTKKAERKIEINVVKSRPNCCSIDRWERTNVPIVDVDRSLDSKTERLRLVG